ncbi:proline-rich protein 36-like [Dromaius novaehollandiae]|uniref:proline-rich protein 36-like n=1 Tax=Dromaius novaehollandiae TaxID=8790 RepID=UPI00311DDE31
MASQAVGIHPVPLPAPLSSAPSFSFFPRGSVQCPIPLFSYSFLCPAPPSLLYSFHLCDNICVHLTGSLSLYPALHRPLPLPIPVPARCPSVRLPICLPLSSAFLPVLLFAFPALCPPLQPSLSISIPLLSSSSIYLPPYPSFPLFCPISLSELPSLFFSLHLSGQLFVVLVLFPSLLLAPCPSLPVPVPLSGSPPFSVAPSPFLWPPRLPHFSLFCSPVLCAALPPSVWPSVPLFLFLCPVPRPWGRLSVPLFLSPSIHLPSSLPLFSFVLPPVPASRWRSVVPLRFVWCGGWREVVGARQRW